MDVKFDSNISFSLQQIANHAARDALIVDPQCKVKDIHITGNKWVKRINWSNGYIAELVYYLNYLEPGMSIPEAKKEQRP